MTERKYGLTTAEHNNIDVDAYYARVFECLKRYKGGVIVDAFSGGPRDTLKMMDILDGDGFFVAIDGEAEKINDLVNKNFDIAAREAEGLIVPEFQLLEGKTLSELAQLFFSTDQQKKVAVIQQRFPAGKENGYPSHNLQADFVLCNAGIMFVPPEDLDFVLSDLTDMLNTYRSELVLRFSQARDDKAAALGETYFIHDPDHVQAVLEEAGLKTERFADLPDPDNRGFEWVDISATIEHA